MFKNKQGWLKRLKEGMQKSSTRLTQKMLDLFSHRQLDTETLDHLEDILIEGDLGPATAQKLVHFVKKERFPPHTSCQDVQKYLAEKIALLISPFEQPLLLDSKKGPWVGLFVGVNGSGKTTTIGKLAALWALQKKQVSLIAADTFRAAGAEQLSVWGQRARVRVKEGTEGADAAGLVFSGLEEAVKKKDDVVLIDTAGRLHNKKDLMDELRKIFRVIKKVEPTFPHSCILIIDGTTGQNADLQIRAFSEILPLTGLILTKLDGTARGGAIVGLLEKFQLPLHAIGLGEGLEDLQPFCATHFAHQLMGLT